MEDIVRKMEDTVRNIQNTYNDAINICYTHPNSYISAANPTICAVEQLERSSVGERVRALHSERAIAAGNQLSSDEDEIDPMYKRMCGCRLTTRVIFVMLLLGISQPIGPDFMYIYGYLLNHYTTNKIMGGMYLSELPSIIESNYYINDSLQFTPNLFIVQILKRFDRRESIYDLIPVHSFIVVVYPDLSCGVISSWYGGFDGAATSLIYTKIPDPARPTEFTTGVEELQEQLSPEGLLNTEYTDKLFGEGNSLEGELKTIFISKEAIIGEQGLDGIGLGGTFGGGRRERTNKKRKTRRKTRRKTKRKTKRKTRRKSR